MSVLLMILAGCLADPTPLFAGDDTTPLAVTVIETGPQGHKILLYQGSPLDIGSSTTERAESRLNLYLQKTEAPPPRKMSVTFFRADRPFFRVRLQALASTRDGFYHYQSVQGPGGLPEFEPSSMEFGYRIDLEPDAP
jgi:hypothetical protein